MSEKNKNALCSFNQLPNIGLTFKYNHFDTRVTPTCTEIALGNIEKAVFVK